MFYPYKISNLKAHSPLAAESIKIVGLLVLVVAAEVVVVAAQEAVKVVSSMRNCSGCSKSSGDDSGEKKIQIFLYVKGTF